MAWNTSLIPNLVVLCLHKRSNFTSVIAIFPETNSSKNQSLRVMTEVSFT
ncbi:hypothetical protein L1049_004312 [Liquidambar formosana]|uniref:Uncharacterized protein n=1 Tax=Liquidambar formosana TaxID=63359 RepID=A0AAP0WY77_LIQFO